MSQLEQQMKHRDKDMVPSVLVKGMFALMALSLAIAFFAKVTNTPMVGVAQVAPVEVSKDIVLIGSRGGSYEVFDTAGARIAGSDDLRGGFIGVIGRVVDRERMKHGVSNETPVTIVRRTNGNIAILDPSTEMAIELIGYGGDNVAAFAQFVN